LTLRPQLQHEALQKSRQQHKTQEWQKQYIKRAGIEGTIWQAVREFGLRECRYIGLAKTHLQHVLTAVAINMAVYPLAVPHLLNPAGIASLVILSSEIDSFLFAVMLVGLVLLVGLLDFAVFRNMDKLTRYLDPSRLVVTEVIFRVLLAALAVQLMASGLAEMGVIAELVGY
jgi:hypothetical protein